MQNRPIDLDDPDDIVRVCKVFNRSSYTVAGIKEFMGVKVPANPIPKKIPPLVLPFGRAIVFDPCNVGQDWPKGPGFSGLNK